MNNVDRENGLFPDPRIYEIHHLGRSQFEQLVGKLSDEQLLQLRESHADLRRYCRMGIGVATALYIGMVSLLRYH